MTAEQGAGQSRGWCSLRLRFDDRELTLLRGAERLRGTALAQNARPQVLRTALSLAKAGRKLGVAAPGGSIVLDEAEVGLLAEAVRFAVEEVQWATRAQRADDQDPTGRRREAVHLAFPELVERGAWRSFGLSRELETVGARLRTALSS